MKFCTWHLAHPRRWLMTTTHRSFTPIPLQPKHIPRNNSRHIHQYPYLKLAWYWQICQRNTGSVSFFRRILSMNGTDPRSTQKTNMKGHPDSPLSSNICKHPSIHPSFYSNSSPSQSIGDGQKGSAFILEYLKDPQTAFSDEPTDTLFHCVFDIDVPLWEWYELPEQSYRRRRFGVAMHGIGLMQPH